MRFILLIFSFSSVLAVFSQAQTNDTVIHLNQVQITASRLNGNTSGLKIISIDSLALASGKFSNLDEIISRKTPVYIKSYGQGGLATIAFRGTAATHTGVYWNGIQLNPPNAGLFDLSLAPTAWFNSVQILSGGSASAFGSGNIGGSIFLGNEPKFGEGLNLNAAISAGSFNNYGAFANAEVSGKKFYSSTGLLYRFAENDFPYQNLDGEESFQKNAACNNYGIMQDLYWKLNEKWLTGISLWLQSNDREIPATLVSKESIASQEDESARSVLSVRNLYNKGYATFKLAYFHDFLHYMDPSSLLESDRDSRVTTNKITAEVLDNRKLLKNTYINTGVYFTYESGKSNNYEADVSRNQAGLFASAMQNIPAIQWQVKLIFRQDFFEGYSGPFTPALELEGKIWKFLSGRATISKNFRIPSFNEMYWEPYGNEDLEPERSWNEEAGLTAEIGRPTGHHSSEFSITGYNSNVNEWILWIPTGNFGNLRISARFGREVLK